MEIATTEAILLNELREFFLAMFFGITYALATTVGEALLEVLIPTGALLSQADPTPHIPLVPSVYHNGGTERADRDREQRSSNDGHGRR